MSESISEEKKPNKFLEIKPLENPKLRTLENPKLMEFLPMTKLYFLRIILRHLKKYLTYI